MGFYERRILPRLIDLGMRQKQLAAQRERVVGEAQGQVLEVGIGSGRNLPFYRRNVDRVLGVDPSEGLLALARRRTAWTHFPVQLRQAAAEDLPVEDRAIDTVVMTWTLCSVVDPAQALSEIRRVLRPGGSLLFVEHGRAPEPRLQRWQDRLTPLWRGLLGGCHLNRPMNQLVEQSGLRLVELETGYFVKGPRVATYHYRGRALA